MTRLVDQLSPTRPKAKSLIVTVYGDSILPLGGACWLGELIELMSPFGLNERVTRTAVFRLVQDGILEAERVGRRSRYTLTPFGRRAFDSAQTRIYASSPPPRDGQWTLIILHDTIPPTQRDHLISRLGWQGFARLTPGLLGAARGDLTSIAEDTLTDLSMDGDASIFVARATKGSGLLSLAERSWPLEEIASDYTAFLTLFDPVKATAAQITGEQAFITRILLIHAYRRILLRDPILPDDLLPPNWPGPQARALARALYHALSPATDAYLESALHLDMAPPTGERLSRFS